MAALDEFAEGAARLDADVNDLAVSEQLPRAADEHPIGKRRRQIVDVPGLAAEEG
jgi:hypothetical protein